MKCSYGELIAVIGCLWITLIIVGLTAWRGLCRMNDVDERIHDIEEHLYDHHGELP